MVTEGTVDIDNNRSIVNANLYVDKQHGSGYFSFYGGSPAAISGSVSGSSSWGPYDFRNYTTLHIGSWSQWVAHNEDGSKVASGSYSASDSADPTIGSASGSWSLTLTTIPRATDPTVSPSSGNTAQTFTINHVPATSSFYHDVAYSLNGGTSYTNIQTDIVGTDTSTDWTPAHSLLPNTASATAIIRVITRASAGGTIIGTKTVNLPLTVPANIKPAVSSVSFVDDQTSSPDMPTLMGGAGRFVQGWSKLKPTVTHSPGTGASSTGATVTMAGQTTPSGTAFANPVTLSGDVPYSAIAADSRGRTSDPYANTVAATAYNFPNLPTPSVVRTSDAAGNVPSPTGTYLAITPAASVSDLTFGGSQKNLLEYQIRTRPVGGAWTTIQAWTATGVTGTTWTAKRVLSGYAANTEYEVEVSVRDLFGKNGYRTSQTITTLTVPVPSEEVFMDWDGTNGISIGGYRRYGIVDVHGDLYAENLFQNSNAVLDTTDIATETAQGIVELATSAETRAGTDAERAVTPAGLRLGMARVAPASVTVSSGSGSFSSLGKVTFSGTNTVSLIDIFTADYLNYLLVFNITYAEVGTGIYARFGNGSTFDTSGYNYSYSEHAGSGGWSNSAAADSIRIGRAAAAGAAGRTFIFSPYPSNQKTWTESSSMDTQGYHAVSGGYYSVSGAKTHTSVQMSLGSGTLMNGTLQIYGMVE